MEPASSFDNLSFENLADLVLRQDQFPLRSVAMRRLAELARQEPDRLMVLKAALSDEDSSTRRRAAQTLGCCGSAARSVVMDLCASMRTDPMWTVREAAVHALRAICFPIPVPLSSFAPRKNATFAERKATLVFSPTVEDFQPDDIPSQFLECALNDREPLVREAAVQGLATFLADENISDPAKNVVWEGLQFGMRHSQESRRCRAVTAMCELGTMNPAIFSAIALGLQDSHWKVRRTTAQELGKHPGLVLTLAGMRHLLPELVKRQFDQHGIVQNAVRETLLVVRSVCENAELVEMLARLTGHPSATAALADVAGSAKLSEAKETEFRQLCQRRLHWLSETIPSAKKRTGVPGPSLEEQTRTIIDRAADREKEAAWLLARWLEIVFAAAEAPSTNG